MWRRNVLGISFCTIIMMRLRTWQKYILATVIFTVFSVFFLLILFKLSSDKMQEAYDDSDVDIEEVMAERREIASNIFINGTDYRMTHPVSTYLVIGTDDGGNVTGIGDSYLGDCADSLMLVMVDDEEKTYGAIQIDRDTMMDVNVLDSQGEFAFTYYMQLCLAHVYGGDPAAGCRNLEDVVSELMGELNIDAYYALPISSVQKINNLLGGVTVTIEDDFSQVDPSLTQGEEITLSDEQAEHFVRGRMNIGEGDNVGRMRRQKTFVEALRKQFEEKREEDPEFVSNFLSLMQSDATTDINLDELKELFDRMNGYQYLGEFEPEGWFEENDTFSDGTLHKEFYADEASLESIINELYPVEEDN